MARRRNGMMEWLVVLGALILLGGVLGGLLYAQGQVLAGQIVAYSASVLLLGWVLFGLFKKRETGWAGPVAFWVVGTLAVAATWGFLYSIGEQAWSTAMLGVWGMVTVSYGGILLIRQVLSGGTPIVAVARTVVDEAVRMKIVLIFLIALLVCIPVLPAVLDESELLKYRMALFLSWSMSGLSVLLSIMTIVLGCFSVTRDVKQRTIFLTSVKPITRIEYLIGKWVGIAMLNLVLVAVGGAGIYASAKALQSRDSVDANDRIAVDEQLMVARESIQPDPPPGVDLDELVEARLEQLRLEQPDRFANPTRAQRQEALRNVQMSLRTIGPRETAGFVFEDVDRAANFGRDSVQLRFKPRSSRPQPENMLQLVVFVNGRPFPPVQMRDGMLRASGIRVAENKFQVLDIPLWYADDDGDMLVSVSNVNLNNPDRTFNADIALEPGELEMLYQVGEFEGNLARGLALIWFRLGFLAMAAIACASFLGFPVAAMFALLIYAGASSSGTLIDSLDKYGRVFIADRHAEGIFAVLMAAPATIIETASEGRIEATARAIIQVFGYSFVGVIPSFSQYNPVPQIADGRLVSWETVASAFGQIFLLWTGLAGFIAWLLFRRRELARVIV